MENALYTLYSLVVLYHKTHSFAALNRSFYNTSRLVNKNRTRALSMKYSLSLYIYRHMSCIKTVLDLVYAYLISEKPSLPFPESYNLPVAPET